MIIYIYQSVISGRKEMFDLRLYGIRLMVKDQSDSERENLPLPPLSNQQQGIFYICHPTDRIIHTIKLCYISDGAPAGTTRFFSHKKEGRKCFI